MSDRHHLPMFSQMCFYGGILQERRKRERETENTLFRNGCGHFAKEIKKQKTEGAVGREI